MTVQNTGNVTLTGVTMTDPNADVGSIVRGADVVGDNDALLEVGETWGYTAKHTLTQGEIDSNGGGDGDIDNIATADSDQTGPDTENGRASGRERAELNIVNEAVNRKTADVAGEKVKYTNTGAKNRNEALAGGTMDRPEGGGGG